MIKMFIFLLSLSLLTIFSCVKKVDVEADKETLIKMSVIDWDKNVMSGNIIANINTYIDNGMRIETDGTVLVGKDVISKSFKNFFVKYKVEKCDNKVEDIRVSGNLAAIRGSFSGTFVPRSGGEPIHEKSAWVAVYERQTNGSWKLVYDIGTNLKE
jgi:ketosteroid isomerase-like protein